MDRFDEMRIFARVVEMRSFRQAASALGLPASTVTDAVKRAEARLGVRLLDRTTRLVAPTLDGEVWYGDVLKIIAALEDAEAGFRAAVPSGRLRVDVHGKLARHFLLPHLPDFLAANPGIQLTLSEGDRLVDLIREGVDCVIRAGTADDSDLVRRRLGELPEVTAASPAYLARHGVPLSVDELDHHRMVGFLSSRTGGVLPLEFTINGKTVSRTLPPALVVSGAETMLAAARHGLGLIQAPRYGMADDLAAGRLVEVLGDCPPPPMAVAALFPRNRQLSPRLRVFLDWLVGLTIRG